MTVQLNLGALPDSKYAAQLQKSPSPARFPAALEREFIRDSLGAQRLIVRFACTLALLLLLLRTAELAAAGALLADPLRAAALGAVALGSVALAWLAFSRAYLRLYLPIAHWLVPLRSALLAVEVVMLACGGEPLMMMLLPLLLVGPLFFLGLPFRAGLLSAALAFLLALATAIALHLPPAMLLGGSGLLFATLLISVLAARVNERRARREFLERRLLGELAQQDALTWTKNRLVFDETLGRLWSQAAGAARSLAIGLIDIDDFKAYNDRYGHQAGDAALRRAAQAIERCVRRPLDLVARYGGEEFGVILFDTDRAGAAAMAEAMRCAVESLAIEHDTSRCGEVLTISVGVAVLQPSAGRNAYGALQLADEALYQAKSKGRNRIEVRDEAEHGLLVTGEFSRDIIAMVRQGAPAG